MFIRIQNNSHHFFLRGFFLSLCGIRQKTNFYVFSLRALTNLRLLFGTYFRTLFMFFLADLYSSFGMMFTNFVSELRHYLESLNNFVKLFLWLLMHILFFHDAFYLSYDCLLLSINLINKPFFDIFDLPIMLILQIYVFFFYQTVPLHQLLVLLKQRVIPLPFFFE